MKKILFITILFSLLFLIVGCKDRKIKQDSNKLDVIFYTAVSQDTSADDYDKNGNPKVLKQLVNKNSKLTMPNTPTARGAVFDGWYKDFEKTIKWDFDKDIVSESMTLYAKWVLKNYKITFLFPHGGDFPTGSTIIREYKTGEIIEFDKPIRENSKFQGWYRNPYSEEQIISSDDKQLISTEGLYEDLTLYAAFKYKEYRIDYYPDPNSIQAKFFNCKYNQKISNLPKDLKSPGEGKTFKGWFLKNKDGSWGVEVNNETIFKWTNDINIYARWD